MSSSSKHNAIAEAGGHVTHFILAKGGKHR